MLSGYLICNRQKWICLGWKFGGVSGGRAGTGCVWDSHTPPRPCPVSVTWVQLSHPALPTLSQREALPWKGNALKAGVGEQVGTRRTVSGTLSYPMALLHHRWQVGLVIFFPWVLFALVAFNLYLEIIVDLQKSCKEHTHNFHIPLSQFPLIFRDNVPLSKPRILTLMQHCLLNTYSCFSGFPTDTLVCFRTQGLVPYCL